MSVLANDPREITGLYGENDQWQISIGLGASRIVAYLEDGDTVWFEIYRDDGTVSMRINSRYVATVAYKKEDN